MAKINEADPRWIVENREDGKNVNNWHWSSSDRLDWSKNVITDFLKQTIIDNDDLSLKITSVPTVEGECNVSNRKGKTIFLYEISVKANWVAESKLKPTTGGEGEETTGGEGEETTGGESVKVNGEFSIPYISDENNEEEPRVTFSFTSPKADNDSKKLQDKITPLLKSTAVPFVQQAIIKFIRKLKQDFALKPNVTTTTTSTTTINTNTTVKSNTVVNSTSPTPVKKVNTKTLTIKEEFQASPSDAYDVFINPDKIKMYTQDKVEFEAKAGGKFSMYNGMIRGTNVELVPGQKIVQKWRLESWPAGVESDVTISFKVEGKPATQVEIIQTGVPTEEFDKTEEGWRRNILERLKSVFGYGTRLNF